MSTQRKALSSVRVVLDVTIEKNGDFNRKTGRPERIERPIQVQKHEMLIDFVRGRYRFDYEGSIYDASSKSLKPYRATDAFDGKILRSVSYPFEGPSAVKPGIARNSDFAEITGGFQSVGFNPEIKPYFMSLGILPAAGTDPMYPGGFHQYSLQAHSDTFFPMRNPTQPNRGTWLTTVIHSLPPLEITYSYCFDPRIDFSLVSWVGRKNGKPIHQAELSYRGMKSNHQLSGWTYENLADGVLLIRRKYSIISSESNPEMHDGDFAVSPTPGMIASKISLAVDELNSSPKVDRQNFQVTDSGELVPIQSADSKTLRYALLKCILSVLLIPAILVICWRIFSTSRTHTTHRIQDEPHS